MKGALMGALALLVAAAVGCSADAPPATVDLDAPRVTASPGPDVAPDESGAGSGAAITDEPREGEFVRATSAAAPGTEQEVAEVWFTYLAELVRMWSTPDAGRTRLGELATGQAVEAPLAYAEELVATGRRNAGGAIGWLLDVEVTGRRALVTGCVRTSMHEVDVEGGPLETYEPWVRATHRMVRQAGTWKVRRHRLEESVQCV